MQLMKFISVDDKSKPPKEWKMTLWCTTNRLKMFRDFSQFLIDGSTSCDSFIVYDEDNNIVYDFNELMVGYFGMRKRNSDEVSKKVQTGKWTNADLEDEIRKEEEVIRKEKEG